MRHLVKVSGDAQLKKNLGLTDIADCRSASDE